ncbi:MAG TPA: tRNA (adenosine(37)-N6)-threonylcarbamoyltransferase complex dimerization subunit type 1 TsaB [Mycobacteriales bacterium]|nr:tRNA (adenosine(37)-N6)-threonylcarbamoyltransferase complex dimerization subunit type 1 TsaB [Mycobacteriales bacterium]
MLVLALDTSTPATSVALVDDRDVLAERTEVAANRHGELLSPLIDAVLVAAGVRTTDVGMVAVGVGPGPFTGLRVGMATAVGFADALGVPVRGACSLDAVAWAAGDRPWEAGFVVVTDARRKEVYWARYAGGRRVDGPLVDRPAAVAAQLGPATTVVGFAAGMYPAEFAGHAVVDVAGYPAASAVARLGADDAWQVPVHPMYLRRPDARPPGAPKRVTPV